MYDQICMYKYNNYDKMRHTQLWMHNMYYTQVESLKSKLLSHIESIDSAIEHCLPKAMERLSIKTSIPVKLLFSIIDNPYATTISQRQCKVPSHLTYREYLDLLSKYTNIKFTIIGSTEYDYSDLDNNVVAKIHGIEYLEFKLTANEELLKLRDQFYYTEHLSMQSSLYDDINKSALMIDARESMF